MSEHRISSLASALTTRLLRRADLGGLAAIGFGASGTVAGGSTPVASPVADEDGFGQERGSPGPLRTVSPH